MRVKGSAMAIKQFGAAEKLAPPLARFPHGAGEQPYYEVSSVVPVEGGSARTPRQLHYLGNEAERRAYARDKPQGCERPAFHTEVLREHFQPALGPRVPHAQFAHTSKCDHCQRVPWHCLASWTTATQSCLREKGPEGGENHPVSTSTADPRSTCCPEGVMCES